MQAVTVGEPAGTTSKPEPLEVRSGSSKQKYEEEEAAGPTSPAAVWSYASRHCEQFKSIVILICLFLDWACREMRFDTFRRSVPTAEKFSDFFEGERNGWQQ